MTIEVSAITPGIGAEIQGFDISQPLDQDAIAGLRELFLRHLVLVFRDQMFSREDHKQFVRHFGILLVHPSHRGGLNKGGDPEIFVIDTRPMLNKVTVRPGTRMSASRRYHLWLHCCM